LRPRQRSTGTASAPGEASGPPIVLVHGAWVGEWCWDPILPLLATSGRPVYRVSLTGHGARSGGSGPHVTLAHHVGDVVAVFEANGISNATLVAHSYGGRVITKAWPELRSRIRQMIYLDAHAPVGPEQPDDTYEEGEGMIPFSEFVPGPEVFATQTTAAAFYERLMPQSTAALREPYRVDLPADLDKTFVHASKESSPRFRHYAEAARSDPSWHYVEIPGAHWLMYTNPREVAAVILDPHWFAV
jgi:pimeloyl-ACP methyl ester carboxylesterase